MRYLDLLSVAMHCSMALYQSDESGAEHMYELSNFYHVYGQYPSR